MQENTTSILHEETETPNFFTRRENTVSELEKEAIAEKESTALDEAFKQTIENSLAEDEVAEELANNDIEEVGLFKEIPDEDEYEVEDEYDEDGYEVDDEDEEDEDDDAEDEVEYEVEEELEVDEEVEEENKQEVVVAEQPKAIDRFYVQVGDRYVANINFKENGDIAILFTEDKRIAMPFSKEKIALAAPFLSQFATLLKPRVVVSEVNWLDE